MKGTHVSLAGRVTEGKRLRVIGLEGQLVIDEDIEDLRKAYRGHLPY